MFFKKIETGGDFVLVNNAKKQNKHLKIRLFAAQKTVAARVKQD